MTTTREARTPGGDSPERNAPPQAPAAQHYEELTYDEVIARYPGQWIVMKVTEFDKGWPTRGYVLTHEPTQDAADLAERRFGDVWDILPGPYATFEAVRLLRTGAEVQAWFDALAQGDIPDHLDRGPWPLRLPSRRK